MENLQTSKKSCKYQQKYMAEGQVNETSKMQKKKKN